MKGNSTSQNTINVLWRYRMEMKTLKENLDQNTYNRISSYKEINSWDLKMINCSFLTSVGPEYNEPLLRLVELENQIFENKSMNDDDLRFFNNLLFNTYRRLRYREFREIFEDRIYNIYSSTFTTLKYSPIRDKDKIVHNIINNKNHYSQRSIQNNTLFMGVMLIIPSLVGRNCIELNKDLLTRKTECIISNGDFYINFKTDSRFKRIVVNSRKEYDCFYDNLLTDYPEFFSNDYFEPYPYFDDSDWKENDFHVFVIDELGRCVVDSSSQTIE